MSSPENLRSWQPQRPHLRPLRLVVTWIVSAVALMLAASVLSGVTITGLWGAMLVAATVAVLNAFVPPMVAALRLPATLLTGFLMLIAVNALMIEWASSITDRAITVSGDHRPGDHRLRFRGRRAHGIGDSRVREIQELGPTYVKLGRSSRAAPTRCRPN